MNILHYVFLYVHVLLAFVFCIAVCDVLGVGCCITLSNAERAASSLQRCCVYCEEHFTIRNEVFFWCYTLVKLWDCTNVVLTLNCVFMLIVVHLLSLLGTKYETWHTVGGKICEIKCCLWKIWNFYQLSSGYYYYLVQDLRCWQWWVFIMWSGLGHHIIWYICLCWKSILGLSLHAIRR
jgi:hypothetical protein